MGPVVGPVMGAVPRLTPAEAALLDALHEPVVVADAAGRVVHANAAAGTLLGWDPDRLRGRPLEAVVPERYRDRHRTGFARFVAGPGTGAETQAGTEARAGPGTGAGAEAVAPGGQVLRVTALRSDGDEVDVEVRVATLPDGLVVGALRDVREVVGLRLEAAVVSQLLRVMAEQPDRREAARRIVRAVGLGLGYDVAALWSFDRAAGALRCAAYWSARWFPAFEGVTRRMPMPSGVGLPGRVWASGEPLWIPDLAADANFPRAPQAGEVGLRTAFAFPLRDEGRVLGVIELLDRRALQPGADLLETMAGIGGLVAVFLRRSQDEEERQRLVADLETERSLLEAVLREMPAGVLIADAADGSVVLGNGMADRLLGPPVHQPVPQPAAGPGPPRLAYRWLQPDGTPYDPATLPLARALAADREVAAEVPVRRGDGTRGVLAVSAAPVHDRHGRTVSAVATLRDVTDRSQAEQRLWLLAEASHRLSGALDYDEPLGAVARLLLAAVADGCLIDVEEGDGTHRRVVVACVDPALEARARAAGGPAPASVVRHGQAVLWSDVAAVDATVLDADGRNHLALLQALEARTAIVAPLVGQGRPRGALTVFSAARDRAYGHEELELVVELGRRIGLTVANAQLFRWEHAIAGALQNSLLPPRLPAPEGLEVGAVFHAGGLGLVVGGDFYDAFALGPGRWAVAVGDVCGTGAEAAALTAQVRHTARAVAVLGFTPSQVLRHVNAALLDQGDEARFCTAVYGSVDVAPGRALAVLAGAGHPLPLVLRAGGAVETVECRGTLLGVTDEVDLREVTVELGPGDALVFYTDGVVEARGADGRYGDDALVEAVAACAGLGAAETARRIEAAVLAFAGGSSSDDIAVLVVRVPAP
jgi:serine phosphatase RsbU (regulator of sigma subunit)/PAS domain-containing protein